MEKFNTQSCRICFFDSGIGGLNLFAECVKKYPFADFIYFADNYNVPYGSRTTDEVRRLTRRVFKDIIAAHPVAAVVACNTVTALCIDELRKECPFPVVGIQPAVKPAAENCRSCLVLATEATANSQSVSNLVEKYGKGRATVRACPGLAEYIECNIDFYPEIDVSALLPECRADAVVLGCTHYAFASKSIAEFYGCRIFDGILGTADHLGQFLGTADHLTNNLQKITFIGGNCDKNKRIFDKLISVSKTPS